MRSRFAPLLALIKGLQPKVKLAVAGAAITFVALVFATCSACRRSGSGGDGKSPVSSATPSLMPITLAVTSFNFIGDGLRDALDPRIDVR